MMMDDYGPAHTCRAGGFRLRLHHYLAAPPDPDAPGASLDFGADFKLRFDRAGPQRDSIGLIQLVQPSSHGGCAAPRSDWRVDRAAPATARLAMLRCLHGEAGKRVASDARFHAGQAVRQISTNSCWLIALPRASGVTFVDGWCKSDARTRFANYVVDTVTGKVFDGGITWGYYVVQNVADRRMFGMIDDEPVACSLLNCDAHVEAIARFLDIDRLKVEACVA